MLGSQLLDQQPFFRGADFGAPELSLFGMCHFRRAVMTRDSWQEHDGVEFLFMLAGEACWEFSDERLAQIKGGQAFVFPAGSRHRIVNGVYPPGRALWIVFNAAGSEGQRQGLMSQAELRSMMQETEGLRSPVNLDGPAVKALAELSQRLGDDRIFLGSPILKAEIRSRLYAALIGLWSGAANRRDKAGGSEQVKIFETSLRRDLSERIPIEELARDTGYGHSQLYALFKREAGMSPNDYRQRLRIKQSCRLLLETRRPVTEIGLDFGFSSSQYFSRVFKKYVGTSPSEYRRLAAATMQTAD